MSLSCRLAVQSGVVSRQESPSREEPESRCLEGPVTIFKLLDLERNSFGGKVKNARAHPGLLGPVWIYHIIAKMAVVRLIPKHVLSPQFPLCPRIRP